MKFALEKQGFFSAYDYAASSHQRNDRSSYSLQNKVNCGKLASNIALDADNLNRLYYRYLKGDLWILDRRKIPLIGAR